MVLEHWLGKVDEGALEQAINCDEFQVASANRVFDLRAHTFGPESIKHETHSCNSQRKVYNRDQDEKDDVQA